MIYHKDNIRFGINQLKRMGLTTPESIEIAGFTKLNTVQPSHDSNIEYLKDNGTVNGKIDWVIIPLPSNLLASKLAVVKEKVLKDLKENLKNTIGKGFSSSALGVPYHYDIDKLQDQVNLIGAKLANREILINCTSQTDIKIPRMHTAIQCDIVFNDGVDWVESNKIRFWDYVTLLEVAEYSAAKDVVWVDL